jgi:hypothetical protein
MLCVVIAVTAGGLIGARPAVRQDSQLSRHNLPKAGNFPTANWKRSLQAGDLASQRCNGGSAPASEPETRALIGYLQRGFDCVISLHSRGGFLDFNGPHARQIAAAMSRACDLPVQRIAYQSSITGSLGQYVQTTWGIPVITVELSHRLLTRGLVAAVLKASASVGALVAKSR